MLKKGVILATSSVAGEQPQPTNATNDLSLATSKRPFKALVLSHFKFEEKGGALDKTGKVEINFSYTLIVSLKTYSRLCPKRMEVSLLISSSVWFTAVKTSEWPRPLVLSLASISRNLKEVLLPCTASVAPKNDNAKQNAEKYHIIKDVLQRVVCLSKGCRRYLNSD